MMFLKNCELCVLHGLVYCVCSFLWFVAYGRERRLAAQSASDSRTFDLTIIAVAADPFLESVVSMQSEDGECLSPEPQAASASAAKGADDELDFEGDFPAVAGTEETVRKQEKEDGEDGEVPESESGHTEDSDLEEGELKEDEDDVAASSDVCKYYPRGSCTWGSDCRFSHQSGQLLSRCHHLCNCLYQQAQHHSDVTFRLFCRRHK